MAYLRHQEAHEHLRDKVVEGIKSYFPDGKLEGRRQGLHLEKIEVGEPLNPDDIRAQHEAKVTGGTWSVPVHATLSLKDNASGKTIDTRRVKVAEIPHITSRYSYIVGGQEYRVDNQWQLKHGVYARRQPNGQLESKFAVGGRSSFSISLNPKTKQFTTEYNDAKIPLYPMMQAMGVSDAQLEKTWGKEILDANKSARNIAGALQAFGKTSRKKEGVDPADHLRTVMSESMLVPEGTEITLGKRFSHVTGETLHLATKKLLQVHNGHPEDDRDSLVFKNLRSAGDFAKDALTYGKKEIMPKINRKIDRATTVRDVVKSSTFGTPVTKVFAGSQLSNYASQVNPAEMLSVAQQTTILGEHGISSDRMVTAEAKVINSSHFGFLDPVSTPEGSSTGIALRLASAVLKVGTEAVLPLHNIKTGKVDYVSPATVLKSKVVLPDQVRWEGNKPVPVSASVKMMGPGNDPAAGKFKDADYVMRRSTHLMNITTNLIPFANNTNGARLGYGSRHMEQSISLLHREKPLVQAGTGLSGTMDTFDKLVGSTASQRSPISGTVHKVDAKGIHIADHAGKSQEVQLYDNYPLNDTKSVYHSEALVKPGDRVSAGQVIADTNFSRDGVLALGTHLRTAYVPYKGLNFEDGVVISESAAKKLSSQHLYKHELKVRSDTVLDPKKFRVQHVGVYTNDQLAPIGDDGVVKVGTKVGPGDPLVLAMSPYKVKDRMDTRSLHKSLSGAHTDTSVKWDGDHVGEVVGVHRSGDKILVHVRTTEGMQVGDKTSTRHGGKGIVTAVLPDHEMPHTKDGKPMELLFNPQGLPGRMNVGQLLEVMAGKIAQKTGKTYVVQNFSPDTHDVLDKVSKELKQHGLSDTEELIDPESKKSLGQVTTGPLYTFKLLHQVDKKLSVRPGMTLPGLTSEADYSPTTMQPRGGGHEGGQAIGALGVYAMLAHGARANLREMQTFKSEGPSMQTNPAKAWPSQHAAVWAAIQTGTPLPTPRPTFAFKKFENMLRAAGINMDKHGHELVLSPLTDKQILEMSKGELKDPTKIVKAALNKNGEPIPEHGGIFDERLTGGHGGNSWSHIALAEPIPNPVFEDPIKKVLGISGPVYESIVFGKKAVDKSGKVVELGHGTTGGAGIKLLLDKIHVPTELKSVESALKKAPASKVDGLLKRVKYLRSLDQLGMKSRYFLRPIDP
jgi:DNA-directed RNA polymerase beta subunit